MGLERDWALDYQCELLCRDKPLGLMVYMRAVSVIQIAEGIAFLRADDPKLFPNEEPLAEDSTSGPECPDIELYVSPLGYDTSTTDAFMEPAFGIHTVALRPTSLGTVRLESNDPFDAPVIDPRYADCDAACPRY